MKKLTTIVFTVAALALLALPTLADVSPVDVGMTNTVAAETTLTTGLGSAVNVENQDNVGVTCAFKTTSADTSTGDITLLFARSFDGTVYETTPKLSFIVPSNSTNLVVGYTNLTVSSIGSAKWLKLVSFQNAATNSLTNVVTVIGKKKIF